MKISLSEIAQIVFYLMKTTDVLFDVSDVAIDVKMLAQVWGRFDKLRSAIVFTAKALRLIVGRKALASTLTRELDGWCCFHYLHASGQAGKADMRIVYRWKDEQVEVLGFGHRFLPVDFYDRMDSHRSDKHKQNQ